MPDPEILAMAKTKPKYDFEEVLSRLPPGDYFLSRYVAKAFGISKKSLWKIAKRYGLGRMLRSSYGKSKVYIYLPEDIRKFCLLVQGTPGNKKRKLHKLGLIPPIIHHVK
jgi:hypothetical protein